jgi:hypothetical protein
MPMIRPAEVADAAQMWAIAQAAYQPYTARIGRPPAPMTADRFADDQARRRGHRRISLYTNVAMTENLAYYPRHGYRETHRGEQDGYQRVFFSKELVDTPRS